MNILLPTAYTKKSYLLSVKKTINPQCRVDKYAHVESKVKKYIEDIKTSEIQHKEELLAAQGFDLSASRNCVDNDDDVLALMGLEARTGIPGSPGGPRKVGSPTKFNAD